MKLGSAILLVLSILLNSGIAQASDICEAALTSSVQSEQSAQEFSRPWMRRNKRIVRRLGRSVLQKYWILLTPLAASELEQQLVQEKYLSLGPTFEDRKSLNEYLYSLKELQGIAPEAKEDLAADLYQRIIAKYFIHQQLDVTSVNRDLLTMSQRWSIPVERLRATRDFLIAIDRQPDGKRFLIDMIRFSLPNLYRALRWRAWLHYHGQNYAFAYLPLTVSALLSSIAYDSANSSHLQIFSGAGAVVVPLVAAITAMVMNENKLQRDNYFGRLSDSIYPLVFARDRRGYIQVLGRASQSGALSPSRQFQQVTSSRPSGFARLTQEGLANLTPQLTNLESASIQKFGEEFLGFEIDFASRLQTVKTKAVLFAQYQNDILTRIIRSFEKSKRRAIDSGSLVKAGELLLDRRATLVGLIQELDEILRDIHLTMTKILEFKNYLSSLKSNVHKEILQDLVLREQDYDLSLGNLSSLETNTRLIKTHFLKETSDLEQAVHALSLSNTGHFDSDSEAIQKTKKMKDLLEARLAGVHQEVNILTLDELQSLEADVGAVAKNR